MSGGDKMYYTWMLIILVIIARYHSTIVIWINFKIKSNSINPVLSHLPLTFTTLGPYDTNQRCTFVVDILRSTYIWLIYRANMGRPLYIHDKGAPLICIIRALIILLLPSYLNKPIPRLSEMKKQAMGALFCKSLYQICLYYGSIIVFSYSTPALSMIFEQYDSLHKYLYPDLGVTPTYYTTFFKNKRLILDIRWNIFSEPFVFLLVTRQSRKSENPPLSNSI